MFANNSFKPVAFRTNGIAKGGDYQVTGAVFYAYPGVYDTTRLQKFQYSLYLTTDGAEVAFGAQFSDDGVHWESADLGIAAPFNGTASWVSTEGRYDAPEPAYLPVGLKVRSDSGAGTSLSNLRLFVRFGVFVRNQTGVAGQRGGTFALALHFREVESGTVMGGPVLCPSGGTTEVVKTPVTPAAQVDQMGKVRLTVNLDTNTGVTVKVVMFQSSDGVNWGAGSLLEDTATTFSGTGITFGTEFVDVEVTPEAPWVRFGVQAQNVATGSADPCAAVVSLRVDWRNP
jgi:hypothetical protein